MRLATPSEDAQNARGASHEAPLVSNNRLFNAPSRNRTENLLIKSQLL